MILPGKPDAGTTLEGANAEDFISFYFKVKKNTNKRNHKRDEWPIIGNGYKHLAFKSKSGFKFRSITD